MSESGTGNGGASAVVPGKPRSALDGVMGTDTYLAVLACLTSAFQVLEFDACKFT